MNVNPQQTNQFLNYQNYHHDQLMHQQYFDENPHAQNYSNFVPYNASSESYGSTPAGESAHHQENFAAMHSNELYEFLPEEIFQLDQPILKSESQTFAPNAPQNPAMENLQLQFTGHNGDITSTSHSFLDLSSGQIQTNLKYPPSTDGFAAEINNNSNYHSGVGVNNVQVHPKAADVNAYSYQVNQEVSSRLNCAVESEKSLKRKHFDIDPVVKHNPPALQQNFHLNQQLFSKRENSCLLQQTAGYYPPDLYASFPSKPNDVYRTMEKYNYITNN
jgi:hypothetical protein